MWKWVVMSSLVVVGSPVAWAMPEEAANGTVVANEVLAETDAPAPLDSPSTFVRLFKAGVDVIDPQPELIYRIKAGEWEAGIAGSLLNAVSKGYHLGRAKLGYGFSNYGYLGGDVDLAGIYGRLAGGKVPPVDKLAHLWSEYATTGMHVGESFERAPGEPRFDWGFTIGASIPWPIH